MELQSRSGDWGGCCAVCDDAATGGGGRLRPRCTLLRLAGHGHGRRDTYVLRPARDVIAHGCRRYRRRARLGRQAHTHACNMHARTHAHARAQALCAPGWHLRQIRRSLGSRRHWCRRESCRQSQRHARTRGTVREQRRRQREAPADRRGSSDAHAGVLLVPLPLLVLVRVQVLGCGCKGVAGSCRRRCASTCTSTTGSSRAPEHAACARDDSGGTTTTAAACTSTCTSSGDGGEGWRRCPVAESCASFATVRGH